MELQFDIKGQIITIVGEPEIIADSQKQIIAKFNFDSDWENTNKTLVVITGGVAYTQIIDVLDKIDADKMPVLKTGICYFSVFAGDKGDASAIHTANKAELYVFESGLIDGKVPEPPTLSEYEQILGIAVNANDKSDNAVLVAGQAVETINSAVVAYGEASASATQASISAQNSAVSAGNALSATENVSIIEQNVIGLKDKVVVMHDNVVAKTDIVIADTNAVSINKEATDSNKALTEQYKTTSEQNATIATEQAILAKYYADQAQSIASSIPMRYYRTSVEGMETITHPIQGDLCYITDFTTGKSQLYVYDTTDYDGDLVNPEWVFLGNLEFANLDRTTLLNILTLATVATSGSYTDLINKPNRYESFATVSNGLWNYNDSDKIFLTTVNSLVITNLTVGAIGIVITEFNLTLTGLGTVKKSPDYDYITATAGQIYVYTILNAGTYLYLTRTVGV